MRKILSFVVAGMMFLSFFACAESQVIYLNCSLLRTSSGSSFAANTVQGNSGIRIDLASGLASGDGIASFVSEASEFQSKVTDLEIAGRASGSIAWIGPGTKMTRGFFSINRITGKYVANYRLEFSQGGFSEALEEGTCTVRKRAF